VLFALSPVASLTVAVVGAITALFAATIGLKQWDIKKVLAYSTVSQLGYMFVAAGVGRVLGGGFHLVTHAFFKALLFLGAGLGDPRHARGVSPHAPARGRAGHAQHGRAAEVPAGHLRP
jgi:NADH-quinone oxidoreductase subunit L